MKHQHRWSEPVSVASAVERGWIPAGLVRHGYSRKCLGPAGGCGQVVTQSILEPVTESDR